MSQKVYRHCVEQKEFFIKLNDEGRTFDYAEDILKIQALKKVLFIQ